MSPVKIKDVCLTPLNKPKLINVAKETKKTEIKFTKTNYTVIYLPKPFLSSLTNLEVGKWGPELLSTPNLGLGE